MPESDDCLGLEPADDFGSLRIDLEAKDPAFAALWAASAAKRSVALALVGLRQAAGLSQADLAARTGWNRGFVSRLEGALGGVPSTATIARYAEACGAVANVAFSVDGRVVDVVPLSAPSLVAGGG
jgi:hypothetical protein